MRVLSAILIVLVAGVQDIRAQVGELDSKTSDRARLIEGVREVAAPGSPGSLAVYAATASSVVTGKSHGGSDVAVIAAAHLGRGRVVAFAHAGYFAPDHFKVADTAKLLVNAVRWASAYKERPRVGLIAGHVEGGNGFTAWSVTIRTPATRHNADGIDIDSLTNATVNQSSIEAGDDGIAVKTNSAAASNITVENTRLYGTHGLSIGSQTFDGVTNVLFNNDYVYGNDLNGNASTDANAINIKSDPDCGGPVNKVLYKNICITNAKHLIVFDTAYGSCSGTKGTPVYTNIVVNGAKSVSSVSGAYTRIRGVSSSNLINAYLANISLDATAQSSDQYAKVELDNSNITPSGTGVTTSSFVLSGSVPSCSF